jgi:hypothetical protein
MSAQGWVRRCYGPTRFDQMWETYWDVRLMSSLLSCIRDLFRIVKSSTYPHGSSSLELLCVLYLCLLVKCTIAAYILLLLLLFFLGVYILLLICICVLYVFIIWNCCSHMWSSCACNSLELIFFFLEQDDLKFFNSMIFSSGVSMVCDSIPCSNMPC